jgi:osmotically-inducible protein OsmY
MVISFVLVIALLGCAGDRTTRSTGEYTEDNVIAAKVKSALIADPDTKGTQVDVEVFKGVVQLSGFVDNAIQVRKAATIASNVGGVTEVRNTLQVR